MRRLIISAVLALAFTACGTKDEGTPSDERPTAATPTSEAAEATPEQVLTPCERITDVAKGESCDASSLTVQTVAKRGQLRLSGIGVRLRGVTLHHELAEPVFDLLERAKGEFVKFQVTVRNRTDEPMEDGPESRLVVDGRVYSPADHRVQSVVEDLLYNHTDIQPLTSQTGTIGFDVPNRVARRVGKSGSYLVIYDADDFTERVGGLISLGR